MQDSIKCIIFTIMIRKLDFVAQLILIGFVLVLGIAALFDSDKLFWAMFLLLPLGLWQLISAGLITAFSGYQGERQKIALYWRVCIPCLVLFISAFFFRDYNTNSFAMALFVIATSGGLLTAVYYLYLYKKYFLFPAENFPLNSENAASVD